MPCKMQRFLPAADLGHSSNQIIDRILAQSSSNCWTQPAEGVKTRLGSKSKPMGPPSPQPTPFISLEYPHPMEDCQGRSLARVQAPPARSPRRAACRPGSGTCRGPARPAAVRQDHLGSSVGARGKRQRFRSRGSDPLGAASRAPQSPNRQQINQGTTTASMRVRGAP